MAKKRKQKSKLINIQESLEKLWIFIKKRLKKLRLKLFSKYTNWHYQLSLRTFLSSKKLRYKPNTFLYRRWFLLLSAAYLLIAGILSFLLNTPQTREEAGSLLVNSAVMVGGSLAIVVSFAQFTIQHAAENLPKNFYRVATSLGKYLAIFLLNTGICLILLGGSVVYGNLGWGLSKISINIAFILITTSFFLLLLLLYWVREDVDVKYPFL